MRDFADFYEKLRQVRRYDDVKYDTAAYLISIKYTQRAC
jgi:hypothetical protein